MLTIVEAGEALHVSERTIRRLIKSGQIDAVRVTPGRYGAIRIRPEALERFLDSTLNELCQREPAA